MKKVINVLAILLILITFSSCRTYITPAGLGTNIGYMPKPMVGDSVRSKIYVTGTYGGATSPNASVNFTFGMLDIARSHTYEEFNFSYGGYGYFGKAKYDMEKPYTLDKNIVQLPSFNKNTAGLGIKTSIGYHEVSSSRNTEFRLMNWENSLAWELGDYTQFRKDLYDSPINYYNLNVSNKTFIWTTGFSTEIIFRSPTTHNFKNAFRFFIGGSKGIVKSFKEGESLNNYTAKTSAAFSFTYYLQYKSFSFTYELATNNNATNKGSLGYSF